MKIKVKLKTTKDRNTHPNINYARKYEVQRVDRSFIWIIIDGVETPFPVEDFEIKD